MNYYSYYLDNYNGSAQNVKFSGVILSFILTLFKFASLVW